MNKPRTTPDEQFLVHLYKAAMAQGNPFSEVEIQVVVAALKLRETATRTIVRDLAQANFIKKWGDETLTLTERGADLVLELGL